MARYYRCPRCLTTWLSLPSMGLQFGVGVPCPDRSWSPTFEWCGAPLVTNRAFRWPLKQKYASREASFSHAAQYDASGGVRYILKESDD